MDHTIAHLQQHLNDLAQAIDRLKPDTLPRWGEMSAHEMVEHLYGTLVISNGRFEAQSEVAEPEWPNRKKFLYTDEIYPRGMVTQTVEKGKTRYADLHAARHKFWEGYNTFKNYWHTHPSSLHMHPMYGPLNREEWLRFHLKHMRHHLSQFGLVPENPA